MFATHNLLHMPFQESSQEVMDILKKCVSASSPVSLVIADSLFGLKRHTWDKEEDMWKHDEFEEVLKFIEVYCIIEMKYIYRLQTPDVAADIF